MMRTPGLRAGGVIKNYRVYGLSSLKRKGYTDGGMVQGPGTATSDSIPASIEGIQPIRLSNGEAVLNRKAVEMVGEDFIHRLNSRVLADRNITRSENNGNEEIYHA